MLQTIAPCGLFVLSFFPFLVFIRTLLHPEKASVDEAYMDLTALVETELRKQGPIDLMSLRLDWEGLAVVGLCLFVSLP